MLNLYHWPPSIIHTQALQTYSCAEHLNRPTVSIAALVFWVKIQWQRQIPDLSKLEADLIQCCCTENRGGEHGGGRRWPRGASQDRGDRRRHLCAHAVHPKAPRDRAPRRPQGHLEPHPGVCVPIPPFPLVCRS